MSCLNSRKRGSSRAARASATPTAAPVSSTKADSCRRRSSAPSPAAPQGLTVRCPSAASRTPAPVLSRSSFLRNASQNPSPPVGALTAPNPRPCPPASWASPPIFPAASPSAASPPAASPAPLRRGTSHGLRT
eukprot:scaffold1849_cov107-Isochrysis_galbana.AAC.3